MSKNSQVRSEYQQRMRRIKDYFAENIQITTNASYADTIIEDIFYEEKDGKYRALSQGSDSTMTKEEKVLILDDQLAVYVEKQIKNCEGKKEIIDAQAQRNLAKQRQIQAEELNLATQELLLAKQEKAQAQTYLAKADTTEKKLESIRKVSSTKDRKNGKNS